MVLFCDVVGFTAMSKEVEPSQVMHFLNELYARFDVLVDEYDMYKLGGCMLGGRPAAPRARASTGMVPCCID